MHSLLSFIVLYAAPLWFFLLFQRSIATVSKLVGFLLFSHTPSRDLSKSYNMGHASKTATSSYSSLLDIYLKTYCLATVLYSVHASSLQSVRGHLLYPFTSSPTLGWKECTVVLAVFSAKNPPRYPIKRVIHVD